MIPILFDASATDFTTNGIGRLADCISGKCTEELNGKYEIELVYPSSGKLFDELKVGRIIVVKPSDGEAPEPFQIYKITRPLNQKVTILAEHISYRLSKMSVMPYTASTCALALQGLELNAAEESPFQFFTDKAIDGDFSVDLPTSIRAVLGGTQGSILQRFKGEYKWTGFNVWLYTHRGSDNGVTIRYGKNLTDLSQEENIENTITGIVPYWANEDGGLVTLPEKVLYSENAENFPYPRTIPIDFSDDFEEPPTEEQLRSRGESYISANRIGVPSVNISLSFVALWQTKELETLASVERVKLGDTIHVRFDKLGVDATAEVIKTDYDFLRERYNAIEVGDPKSKLAETLTNVSQTAAEQVVQENAGQIMGQIQRATDILAGGLGGHVVIGRNADGKPNEILIMDTDDKTTAVNVIRANSAGIGFSQNGYAGPYNSAWTIDGTLDMSQINVLNLTANLIKGGVLQLGTIDNTAGILQVFDEENALIGQLDKSGLKMWGADGSYVLMNQQVGFAGYDRNDNKIYWVSGEEFHQRKSVIEEEITLCNTMRFIPITITDSNQNIVNDGIALVSA